MNIRILFVTLAAFSLLLFASCGDDKAGLTRGDAEIVAEINDRIKADPFLAPQYMTLNVTSESGSVGIFGWVKDDKSYEALGNLFAQPVPGMNGRPNIDVYKHRPLPGDPNRPQPSDCACPAGYISCGDLCIPGGDKCNIGAGCNGGGTMKGNAANK